MKRLVLVVMLLAVAAYAAPAQKFSVKKKEGRDKILAGIDAYQKDPFLKENKETFFKLAIFILESPDIGVVDCGIVKLGESGPEVLIENAIRLGKAAYSIRTDKVSANLIPEYFSLDTQMAGITYGLSIYRTIKAKESDFSVPAMDELTKFGDDDLKKEIAKRLDAAACKMPR